MSKKLVFDVADYDIIEHSNKQFLALRLYAISTGENRNKSHFLRESLDTSIPSVFNKPILAYWNESLNDTEGHNGDLALDDDGNLYWDYSGEKGQRSVGTIPESSNVYVEEHADKDWLVIDNALIWVGYNHKLTKLIEKQRHKKVSVEIDVLESYVLDGIQYIQKFVFDGVTILGKRPDGSEVAEGIPGAHLSLKDVADSVGFAKFKQKMSFVMGQDNSTVLSKYVKSPGEEKKEMPMSARELESALRWKLDESKKAGGPHGWVHDILIDDSTLIYESGADGMLYAVPYNLTEDGVWVDWTRSKRASIKYEFVSKDKWGTEKAITVDKSKDAVSHKPWGEVGKTELRNKVLTAKNYKTLVKSVYLLVESGWEDSPSDHLKYPVMEFVDGKFVYNAGGLLSAQQYGEQHDESVANKAKDIRKKLGLLESEKRENMKAFIENAKKAGFLYLGKIDGKLAFTKMEFEEDEEVEVKVIDEKDDDCEEFKAEDLKPATIRMDEGKAQGEDHKAKLAELEEKVTLAEEAKKKAEMECEEHKAKLAEIEEEIKTKEFDELVEKTDIIVDKFREALTESDVTELIEMRDAKKFATAEDFSRELSYRKFTKELEESERETTPNTLVFGFNNKRNSPDTKSGLDSI